ncbi:MAG: hypothetical protein AAGI07_04060 [Bacteroidota bacterium]
MKNSIVKAIVLAVAIGISGISFANQSFDTAVVGIVDEPVKTEVTYDQLPELIQIAFKQSAYAEETLNTIYKVEDEGTVTYEFHVGAANDVVIITEEGEVKE